LYLRETRTLGLEYSQKKMRAHTGPIITGTFDTNGHDKDRRSYKTFNGSLEGAVDASFADDDGTARSTSGFVIWFCGMSVEFECKRQPPATLSTMESGYVAASRSVLSVRFLHKFMDFMELDRAGPTKIHEDYAACIVITAKPVHRSRSKHTAVKYHNAREAVESGEVELVEVWTEHQVADLFTKSLIKKTFLRLRDTLIGTIPFDKVVESHLNTKKVSFVEKIRYVTNDAAWPTLTMPVDAPNCFLAAILGLSVSHS